MAFSRRLHARIRKTRYMHKMRCLLINRRSLLLALRLLWKTPIFPSNSRFPRLCAKCLLKLKRLVSILPMTKSFFFSSRRRHTMFDCDWSSDVCSSDLDRAEVRVESVLCGLVVIRSNGQHAVNADVARHFRTLNRHGGRIASRAGNHFRAPASELDCRANDELVLFLRHRDALAGGAARHEHAHVARDLILDQIAQTFLVNGAIAGERSNKRRRTSAQPFELHCHGDLRFRISSINSVNSNVPVRPTIQCAATSAPAANPCRERAVCVSSTWSGSESKPTRCVPGIWPARVDEVEILPSTCSDIISRSFNAVPEGASFFRL